MTEKILGFIKKKYGVDPERLAEFFLDSWLDELIALAERKREHISVTGKIDEERESCKKNKN